MKHLIFPLLFLLAFIDMAFAEVSDSRKSVIDKYVDALSSANLKSLDEFFYNPNGVVNEKIAHIKEKVKKAKVSSYGNENGKFAWWSIETDNNEFKPFLCFMIKDNDKWLILPHTKRHSNLYYKFTPDEHTAFVKLEEEYLGQKPSPK